jgi:hypothetical protein
MVKRLVEAILIWSTSVSGTNPRKDLSFALASFVYLFVVAFRPLAEALGVSTALRIVDAVVPR